MWRSSYRSVLAQFVLIFRHLFWGILPAIMSTLFYCSLMVLWCPCWYHEQERRPPMCPFLLSFPWAAVDYLSNQADHFLVGTTYPLLFDGISKILQATLFRYSSQIHQYRYHVIQKRVPDSFSNNYYISQNTVTNNIQLQNNAALTYMVIVQLL